MQALLPADCGGGDVADPMSLPAEMSEWDARVREWLLTLPSRRNVTAEEMDVWIDSNLPSFPDDIKSLPRSNLYGRIISLHKLIRRSDQSGDVDLVEKRPFQRTEQWTPIYCWLESLNTNVVVKTKAINEWLSRNPIVKEQLFLTHSSYQLMHYIHKCHARILRKRGKLQKVLLDSKAPSTVTEVNNQNVGTIAAPTTVISSTVTPAKDLTSDVSPTSILPVATTPLDDPNVEKLPFAPLNAGNLSNDCDSALSRKNEALHKYELLSELERQLYIILSKHKKRNGPE